MFDNGSSATLDFADDVGLVDNSLLQKGLSLSNPSVLGHPAVAALRHVETVLLNASLPNRTHLNSPPSMGVDFARGPSLMQAGMPINSNGRTQARVVDIVLLILCSLIPFVFYVLIELWGDRSEPKEVTVEKQEATTEDRQQEHRHKQQVRRMGSSYNMDAQPANVSLTPFTTKEQDEASQDGTILQNVLAGFSTAMAALPDAISFSFITGMSPLNGIWAGVFMGLAAALVGGRPGMISSASAATAVVLADISTNPNYGMGFMSLCVFIVGVVQLLIGAFRLSRFITMVPHPVMLGFVNGLAIVMIKAQLRQYHVGGDGAWVPQHEIIGMTITAVFAMLAALAWARIPRASSFLPAPLASVLLTMLFSFLCKDFIARRTLHHVAGHQTFAGGMSTFPTWNFPPAGVEWGQIHKLVRVFMTALRFALVGVLESLMTQSLIDQITGTAGSARRECFGQGVGNILSSLFGLQGGCALIAQSLMNVGSGGRTRLSGVVMALSLAACVVVLAPVMAQIPVAALVGLITLIALNTFAWGSLELLLRVDMVDAVVVVVVTVVTVWKDLAIAVLTGIIISGLGFAWHAATEVTVDVSVDGASRAFILRGPLFFGSAMNYRTEVCSASFPEEKVVLEFERGKVLDVSGVDAITKTFEHLKEVGKRVRLQGLKDEVVQQLPKEVQGYVVGGAD